MKKRKTLYLSLLLFFLVGLISLPRPFIDRFRLGMVHTSLVVLKGFSKKQALTGELVELEQIKGENRRLKEHLEGIIDWLFFDQRLEKQLDKLHQLTEKKEERIAWREFFQRRIEEMSRLIRSQMEFVQASVIYREPISWSSSLWIDIGEKENERLGRVVVAKNSPVLKGGALIGIIEQVGLERSRVRLITDSGLSVAVRAIRGEKQNGKLIEEIELLKDQLLLRPDLFATDQEMGGFLYSLEQLKKRLQTWTEDSYLAKGEITGSSAPLWRSRGSVLKGVGFNYDFADAEGGARDLRTGQRIGSQGEGVQLIQMGDLLVTSGLDGVFPPGLEVGVVSQIAPLQEGDFYYELEAKPAAGPLEDLKVVFILPPLETVHKP